MSSKTRVSDLREMLHMQIALVRDRANGLALNNTMPYAHKNPAFNTLTLEVLTYADLELLKQRRAGSSAPPSAMREMPRGAARR
jgi:hypothetical protein